MLVRAYPQFSQFKSSKFRVHTEADGHRSESRTHAALKDSSFAQALRSDSSEITHHQYINIINSRNDFKPTGPILPRSPWHFHSGRWDLSLPPSSDSHARKFTIFTPNSRRLYPPILSRGSWGSQALTRHQVACESQNRKARLTVSRAASQTHRKSFGRTNFRGSKSRRHRQKCHVKA